MNENRLLGEDSKDEETGGDPVKLAGGALRTPAARESYHQWYFTVNQKIKL